MAANCNLEPVFYTVEGLVLFKYFLFTKYKGKNLAKDVSNASDANITNPPINTAAVIQSLSIEV